MGRQLMTTYIGIDPGVKTGFAVSVNGKLLSVESMRIDQAMAKILWLNMSNFKIKVFIEDARLRKWFGANSNAKQQGAGSIKRDCGIWEDFLQDKGIDFVFIAPKDQKGLTKVKQARFINMTGWTKQTNEHSRDAAMLVWGR